MLSAEIQEKFDRIFEEAEKQYAAELEKMRKSLVKQIEEAIEEAQRKAEEEALRKPQKQPLRKQRPATALRIDPRTARMKPQAARISRKGQRAFIPRQRRKRPPRDDGQ